ncbi:MAG: hypothetical protein HG422_05845 [Prevotella sp.]|nr:hypothetical protein [Prevotella sp.]
MKTTQKINRNKINTKQEQYKHKRAPKATQRKGRIDTKEIRRQHGKKTGATPNDSEGNMERRRDKAKRIPKATRKKDGINTKEP